MRRTLRSGDAPGRRSGGRTADGHVLVSHTEEPRRAVRPADQRRRRFRGRLLARPPRRRTRRSLRCRLLRLASPAPWTATTWVAAAAAIGSALQSLQIPILAVAIDSDGLYPPAEQLEIAELAPLAEIAWLHSAARPRRVPHRDRRSGRAASGLPEPGRELPAPVGELIMRVLKFGGSSVADADRIGKVGSIVSSAFDEGPIVVVVSALGGITDELVALADGAPKNREPLGGEIDAILERHLSVLTEIAPDDNPTRSEIAATIDELRRLVTGIGYIGDCPPAVRDRIIATGERLSAPIVAAALRAIGSAGPAGVRDRGHPHRLAPRDGRGRSGGHHRSGSSAPDRCVRDIHPGGHRFHRRRPARQPDDPRPRRLRPHRDGARRRPRGGAGRDLDRCQRDLHRPSADRCRGPAATLCELRRGRRDGALRRCGALFQDHRPGA